MSPIDWNRSFSVGHAMVDDQHREFLIIMNTMECLSSADSGVGNRKHYLRLLERLMEYTERHFRFENALMQQYDYPGASGHWRSHKDFDMSIYAVYRKVLTAEPVCDISMYMLLRDKFRKHMLNEDKRLFRNLLSHGPQQGLLAPDAPLAMSEDYCQPMFGS